MRPFRQVDVFSSQPMRGNPVAVVHDADDLTEDQMRAFARWTNLSETTFVLSPTGSADYRVRIFTPDAELPFAGHPTLGTAHAWLEAGGVPSHDGVVVQECVAGLVPVRREERLAFEAPPLVRSGPVSEDDLERIAIALRIGRDDIVDSQWVDNGPGWVGVLLESAEAVLGLDPVWHEFAGLDIGVVGPRADGETACEVRAFCPGLGVTEDPVTGSPSRCWRTGCWCCPPRRRTSRRACRGRRVVPCAPTSTCSSGSSTKVSRRRTAPAPAP